MNSTLFSLMNRYQNQAISNHSIQPDYKAYQALPDDFIQTIHYQRPRFNFPASNSPHASIFSLREMALNTLKNQGFIQESYALDQFLNFKLSHLQYKDVPSLLFRFLDFSPPTPLTEEQKNILQKQAQSLGLDLDPSFLQQKTTSCDNIFTHHCHSLMEEWQWLVHHVDQFNSFNKTAVDYINPRFIQPLIAEFLPQINQTDLNPEDSSFINYAWFKKNYPAIFSHLDVLHETPFFYHSQNFLNVTAMAYFQFCHERSNGLDVSDWNDRVRMLYNHQNTLGISGSALIGVSALSFLESSSTKADMKSYFNQSLSFSPLNHPAVHDVNQRFSLHHIPESLILWGIFTQIFPDHTLVEQEYIQRLKSQENNHQNSLKADVVQTLFDHLHLTLSRLPFFSENEPFQAPTEANRKAIRL